MKNILWKIGHDLKIETISHANGYSLYDSDGKEYVDMESGVWCTPLGHSHPVVNQAIKDQMDQISHTGYCYAHPIIQETATSILQITDIKDGKCIFLTSGSEAVEVGVKAIQTSSDKPLLLTFSDSFLGSVGSSSKKPLDEWFLFDRFKCEQCSKNNNCDPVCDHFLSIPFDKISGFIFEPGSAAGMVKFPTKSLITNIIKNIKANNGYVQINEITTGMGRTGKWFGFQHYSIEPDVVSIGKGLGNGYPVSAIAFNQRILKQMEKTNFYHSQSHQNDPLGCAAANSVIKEMTDLNLVSKSKSMGCYFKNCLQKLADTHDCIKEVRGRGLIIALEFHEEIDHSYVIEIYNRLIEKGFIVAKRPDLNVFRIDPPLIIDQPLVDDFVETLDSIISRVV